MFYESRIKLALEILGGDLISLYRGSRIFQELSEDSRIGFCNF
jgi:hypothetical protein